MPSLCPGTPRTLAALLCTCSSLMIFGAIVSSAPHAQASDKTQGAALFASKGCSHCHGESGFGGSDSGPDLSHVRKELKAPEIAQQIHDGGNNMPPFGDALTTDEIASLVEYLRSKRKPPPGYRPHPPAIAEPAPQSKPDPE